MKNFIYTLWSKFLIQFSKIKVLSFNFLPILAYDPDPMYVNGFDVLQIMEFIQKGDVLLRGYNKDLDSRFIPDEKGYSHAGLYIGDNNVIHAVAENVTITSIIDFCSCDRIMVLRPKSGSSSAIKLAKKFVDDKVPYDFNYSSDNEALYCFELIDKCYPKAKMEQFLVKQFFGLIKRNCFLAKSIYENNYFKQIFEKNEK